MRAQINKDIIMPSLTVARYTWGTKYFGWQFNFLKDGYCIVVGS